MEILRLDHIVLCVTVGATENCCPSTVEILMATWSR